MSVVCSNFHGLFIELWWDFDLFLYRNKEGNIAEHYLGKLPIPEKNQ